MKTSQKIWTSSKGWSDTNPSLGSSAQLVFAFGGRAALENPEIYAYLKQEYTNANIVLGSTAGEILDTQVYSDSVCVTAIHFETATVQCNQVQLVDAAHSFTAGADAASTLLQADLQHVLVFSDGLNVNTNELLKGIASNIPETVRVTGGLMADGSDFKKTVLGLNQVPEAGKVVIIGLYGALNIGYGSLGGWDTFGVKRTITKSKDNILYEIDGRPALELYKEYLGEQAKNLPSSALLFPLNIWLPGTNEEVVRTILNINEADQSLIFAGDIPEGAQSQLMRANFDRLIDGASMAATTSTQLLGGKKAEFALLVSCVGRRLVLKERTEEEAEGVRDVLGSQAAITGFYSYGELCPTAATTEQCQLHNQTMTITVFSE
jgi:hypothetical protein